MKNAKTDITRREDIAVYNYGNSDVVVSTRDKSYIISRMVDGAPGYDMLTWTEIIYANSRCNAFKRGILRFDKNEEKEIYEALHIRNWESLFTREILEDIILQPTLEKMQKIVNIQDLHNIEFARSVLTELKNKDYGISSKVIEIINRRYDEINRGKMKTNIILAKKEINEPADVIEVNALKEQVALLTETVKNLNKENFSQ